jgi:putative transposase
MGRPHRAAEAGYVYHVLNRANARMTIFEDDADYEAFERVLEEAVDRTKTRLLAYCVLPNHWHLVVWPQEDGELSRFVGSYGGFGARLSRPIQIVCHPGGRALLHRYALCGA